MDKEQYSFQDLLDIMAFLRSHEGCPWDREQTHQSIKKHVAEEAYELIEAIDSNDPVRIADESGDLLLQVVFHAQIGAEEGCYSIKDVTDAICRKMIHRHPQLFSLGPAMDWDEIKRRDRGQKTLAQELKGISTALPALIRCEKFQKLMNKEPSLSISATDKELEMGARLFELVGQCRNEKISAETALHRYLQEILHTLEEKGEDRNET